MSERVEYGKLPGGLIEGWDGIVCWYKTTMDEPDADKHEELVKTIIDKQMSDSFDHWQEWRVSKIETVLWQKYYQVTLCSFYIKDSY